MISFTRYLFGFAVAAAMGATLFAQPTVTPSAEYTKEIETWRAQRRAQLVKPDGWLSLIGLHFLEKGESTFGSAKDNQIVLAKGPAHWGTLVVSDDGRVKAIFNAGLGTKVDGEDAMGADLKDDVHTAPSVVSSGSVNFVVVERGGRKALRVRDSESVRRTGFHGLDYFPIDPSWRIEARWVPFDHPKSVPIQDVLGNVSPATILGKVVFTRDGKSYELLPIQDDPDGVLFFVIADLTTGNETDHGARFLYATPSADGRVVLDFNRAQNPPCAFTPYATCPLPPKENRLPIAVTAGEKKYDMDEETGTATQ